LRDVGLVRPAGNAVKGGNRGAGIDFSSWFIDPPPPELERGLEYTRLLLGRMQEEARERAVNFTVVWIPIREQVEEGRWEELVAMRGLAPGTRQRPQEELGRLAEELGFEAVDLLPAFRREPREPLYFQVDGHWTSGG